MRGQVTCSGLVPSFPMEQAPPLLPLRPSRGRQTASLALWFSEQPGKQMLEVGMLAEANRKPQIDPSSHTPAGLGVGFPTLLHLAPPGYLSGSSWETENGDQCHLLILA